MSVSPRDNPAAYGTVTVGSAAGFVIHEANKRLGWDVSIDEATYFILGLLFVWHLLGSLAKRINPVVIEQPDVVVEPPKIRQAQARHTRKPRPKGKR